MPHDMPPRVRRLWKPIRIARAHYRLLLAIAIGFALALLLPGEWRWSTRFLIGWNLGVTLYLAHAFFDIVRFDIKGVSQRAATEDEGALLILVLTVAAAIASLAAIVAELGSAQASAGGTKAILFLHAAVTILLSWTFIHVIFAFHYAHAYFGEGDERAGGLDFPGRGKPDYWDFVYFSLVVGTTFQTSDVNITSKWIRRTVAAHGVVSFFFNVAILTLTVNIGSNLIEGGN
jgi:uncharacterized membrane protein